MSLVDRLPAAPSRTRTRLDRQRVVADIFVIVALAAWWMTSASLPPQTFPSPWSVLLDMVTLAGDLEFWGHALATASRVAVAVIVATLLGTILGLLPRYLPWTGGIVDEVLVPFFTAFPAIIWAILGTIWFGLSGWGILASQVLIILPFCLVNVTEGSKEIGHEEMEMGRSFGRHRWSLFWRIELPTVSPFIVAGARISYGVCWKISIISELFGGRSGIGYMMQWAQDFGSVDSIRALCLAIVVFVVAGDWLVFRPLDRRYRQQ